MTPDLLGEFHDRIERRLTELTKEDALGSEGLGIVTLDQQAVGRLSRMDAIQQQAMAQATRRGAIQSASASRPPCPALATAISAIARNAAMRSRQDGFASTPASPAAYPARRADCRSSHRPGRGNRSSRDPKATVRTADRDAARRPSDFHRPKQDVGSRLPATTHRRNWFLVGGASAPSSDAALA